MACTGATATMAVACWTGRSARSIRARPAQRLATSPFRGTEVELCRLTEVMNWQDNIDRAWDIIEKVGTCMLTTQFEGGLRARPLEARPDRDAGIIWFVTDMRSGKEHEIEAEHNVGLIFRRTRPIFL
jgi:Pyridoxamine 5'-phosphate oxidase like